MLNCSKNIYTKIFKSLHFGFLWSIFGIKIPLLTEKNHTLISYSHFRCRCTLYFLKGSVSNQMINLFQKITQILIWRCDILVFSHLVLLQVNLWFDYANPVIRFFLSIQYNKIGWLSILFWHEWGIQHPADILRSFLLLHLSSCVATFWRGGVFINLCYYCQLHTLRWHLSPHFSLSHSCLTQNIARSGRNVQGG
jgi:hypothetical protein